MLSSSYAKLVAVALLVALPISYWMANSWLAGFAYSVELEWWFFVLAAVATIVLAWISVSWQTIKAARLNPADGLRSE